MNYEIKDFKLLGQIGQKLPGFPYYRDGKEPPPISHKFANSPPHQEILPPVDSPSKMFIPPQFHIITQ